MEFRAIRQTSRIEGTNRNPGLGEDQKVLMWDNSVGYFVYVDYTTPVLNTKIADGYVLKGNNAAGSGYVWKLDGDKNPSWRKDDFLLSVTRQGNSVAFVMNDSSTKFLNLGALAWEDTVNYTLTLPGNTKILFDDNNTIGGDSSFTFDKINKLVNLTSFEGFQIKNNSDSSYKSLLQYFGNKNLLLGQGVTRTLNWITSGVNTIRIGDQAGGSSPDGSNNVFLGHFSGQNTTNGIQNGVFVGNYSGRLETDDNKFYLGNFDYSTIDEFRTSSLMYGDFSTNWLRINNRLYLPEEIRIGTFNTGNTPDGGMIQFVDAADPTYVKPQYYDNTQWVDFANGANYYLQDVTKATADVGTTDAAYQLTFDMNGIADIILQLGANAFNSKIIPEAAINGTAGLLQVSSGDNSDSNAGFTYVTGLQWSSSISDLHIPGTLSLASAVLYDALDSTIIYNGNHFYGRVNGDWIQLDNDQTTGQSNELRFDGSIPVNGDISLPKDNSLLPIKGLKPAVTDPRILIVDNPVDKDLDFSLNLDIDGTNYTVVTTTLTSANVFDLTDHPEGVSPRLFFRPLISSDNSIQFTITGNNEIDISATGTGNPNIYTLASEGTGYSLKDVSTSTATNWKLKSIIQGNHIVITENSLDFTFDVDDLTLNNSGNTNYLLTVSGFDITQKELIEGLAITLTDGGAGITIDVNKEIPAFSFTTTPVYVGSNLGFYTDYSADIRSSGTLASTKMFEINIGSGLSYNSGTNTLSASASSGSSTDYRLTSTTRSSNDIVFHITDEFGSGTEQLVNTTIGYWGWEDTIHSQYSITGNGTAATPFQLVNDLASVPAGRYYGSDGTGTLGYHSITALGDALTGVFNHTIVRDPHGFVNRTLSVRNVKFFKTSGDIVVWDGESEVDTGLGWLAFENEVPTEYSIEWDSTNNAIRLVNDSVSPGVTKYYGTNGSGTKGFFSLSDLGGGTVVSIGAGNGMDFTTITDSGNVALGTPSSVSMTSTNSVSGTTHTHALTFPPEDREWIFGDFTAGTAIDYYIDVKASWNYTITSMTLVTDTGSLTDVTLDINGTPVTGLDSITADNTITETNATALNSVVVGDYVKLSLGTTYSGSPTKLSGKITIQRV